MSITPKEAVDDMSKIVFDAIGSSAQIHWESVREQRLADDTPWIRVNIRHEVGEQSTLGGLGARDFYRRGLMINEIFTPIGKGLSESYTLAKTITDAFEGVTSPAGVWFRNVRIQEIGKESEFFQTNVLIDFEYFETK